MAGISPIETAARKEKLLELLPEHGWSIIKAGIACGWSPKYCRTNLQKVLARDSSLCERILEKRRSIEAGTQDKRENALKTLQSIIDKPTARDADRVRAVEVMGKMSGWLSETRVLEPRGRILSETEQAEAREFALWRFSTTRTKALPGDIIDVQAGAEMAKPMAKQDEPDPK